MQAIQGFNLLEQLRQAACAATVSDEQFQAMRAALPAAPTSAQDRERLEAFAATAPNGRVENGYFYNNRQAVFFGPDDGSRLGFAIGSTAPAPEPARTLGKREATDDAAELNESVKTIAESNKSARAGAETSRHGLSEIDPVASHPDAVMFELLCSSFGQMMSDPIMRFDMCRLVERLASEEHTFDVHCRSSVYREHETKLTVTFTGEQVGFRVGDDEHRVVTAVNCGGTTSEDALFVYMRTTFNLAGEAKTEPHYAARELCAVYWDATPHAEAAFVTLTEHDAYTRYDRHDGFSDDKTRYVLRIGNRLTHEDTRVTISMADTVRLLALLARWLPRPANGIYPMVFPAIDRTRTQGLSCCHLQQREDGLANKDGTLDYDTRAHEEDFASLPSDDEDDEDEDEDEEDQPEYADDADDAQMPALETAA